MISVPGFISTEVVVRGGIVMARKSSRDQERLRELIEEATVDCYDEDEPEQGLLTMIESNLVCPFTAKVLGETVEVTDLRQPPSGPGLKAVCQSKGKEHLIDITSLEWPKQKPKSF